MSAIDFFTGAYPAVGPLALLLGLLIAARWLPDAKAWLSGIGAGRMAANPVGQLLLWIVLGELFALPIVDWMGIISTILQVGLIPDSSLRTISTVWGKGSFAVFSDVSVLMTLVVYVLVVWTGYRLWPEVAQEREVEVENSLALEEWFALFLAASLVNRFVDSIVMRLIWLPLPSALQMTWLSSIGLAGAWLLGLAILAVVLFALSISLRRYQGTS